MVSETLRHLLEDAAAGGDAVAVHEADVPEPTSAQLPYATAQVVVVPDPFWEPHLLATCGGMTLMPVQASNVFMLIDAKGLGRADSQLARRFNKRRNHEGGYWVSLKAAPPIGSAPIEVLALALNADVQVRTALAARSNDKRADGWWIAVTFMEEGPTREERRRAWVFIRVRLGHGTWKAEAIVQAQALTLAERQRRTPELVGLSACTFVVVGAGSLGAPIAVELVKAGAGSTVIVDTDIYDVNNPVRHLLPVTVAGSSKATAVAEYCQSLDPFVRVEAQSLAIGRSAGINDVIRGASMAIDTTGSTVVARVLYKYCTIHEVPLLVVGLTAGAYGADVALFRPGGGCPVCLDLEQDDARIPRPDKGPLSNVTPIGCSHPAFFGAGFDATEVAAVATRLAISATGATAYPAAPFDWVVLNYRREPRRIQGTLRAREDCWFHPHL
jgi:molybdopterin/thiamine biosynthesis adenylyltransferase